MAFADGVCEEGEKDGFGWAFPEKGVGEAEDEDVVDYGEEGGSVDC